jgi:hypothetical protein
MKAYHYIRCPCTYYFDRVVAELSLYPLLLTWLWFRGHRICTAGAEICPVIMHTRRTEAHNAAVDVPTILVEEGRGQYSVEEEVASISISHARAGQLKPFRRSAFTFLLLPPHRSSS